MKNLKVWQKLAVLGILFLIPFGVVTYKLIASKNKDVIEFAQLELRGVEYIDSTLSLLHGLQDYRDLSVQISSPEEAKTVLQAKVGEIQAAIKSVDEADQKHGATLKVSANWTTVQKSVNDLLAEQKGTNGSLTANFDRQTKLINDVITFLVLVGDNSKLTLDPDVDSYYLMDIHQFQVPQLVEKISHSRGLMSLAAYDEKNFTLQKNITLSEFIMDTINTDFTKSYGDKPSLKAKLEADHMSSQTGLDDSLAAIRRAMALTNALSLHEAVASTQPLSQALGTIYQMNGSTSRELTELLNIRIEVAQTEMNHTLEYAGLGLIAVLVIGIFIMRDITRPMKEVVAVANQMAAGNLTAAAKLESRRDEIGDLTKAFNQMSGVFREMAGVVGEIAEGNLTVKVKPQSDGDVMGHALATMVQRLSSLAGQVQKSSTQVNTSIQDIAATSKEQQATASEIAATTTEIGATSKEISATSKELARTMNSVAKVADEAAGVAGASREALKRMEETMRHISEAAGSINSKLTALNEKAGNINQVITTITKVADQTNLLSLNAAIEAEKAGEYGRGFAVVATEIRRLADQTAVATYDIEQIVKEMQSAVSAGVMGMDKFSDEVRRGVTDVHQVSSQLVQIIESVQTLTPQFESVTEGMQSQSTGAQQISEALLQLTQSSQQTVESLRLSSQTIDQLRDAANGMQGSLSRFKV